MTEYWWWESNICAVPERSSHSEQLPPALAHVRQRWRMANGPGACRSAGAGARVAGCQVWPLVVCARGAGVGESQAQETKAHARRVLASCAALHQQQDVVIQAKHVVCPAFHTMRPPLN